MEGLMHKTIHYPIGLSRFNPLDQILVYDVFNNGFNGWMAILPNFTQAPDFDVRDSIVDKTQWPPVMLSSATYRYPGTHGSLSGTYSLKISTRPVVNPYLQPPAPGSLGHAIKRLSFHRHRRGLHQLELWLAYTVEQDRVRRSEDLGGISENAVRAFGAGFDIQEGGERYFVGARYLNAMDHKAVRRWQIVQAADVSDSEWAYGAPGEWNKRGIDPMWYGKRHQDGSTDGFCFVPDSGQQLCYNETDCKINWLYFRLLFDTAKREYVELQAQDAIYDLRGEPITAVPAYARINGLMNPFIWVENDDDQRVFLYVDSVVVSMA